MLSDNGYPTSCEGDIPGAVTMGILRIARGRRDSVLRRLISYDEKDNTAWYGTASRSEIALPKFERDSAPSAHAGGRGDKKVSPTISPSSGRVTLAKTDQSVDGNTAC